MPATLSYPGVYIEEIPSGVHTITGVATSIGAFFGRTAKGPLNRAVHCFSFSDFLRNFGGAHPSSDLAASVRLFFDNGGTDCYVVRLAHKARKASVDLTNFAGRTVLHAIAKDEGAWGNGLRLEVDYDTLNPGETFNLRVFHEEGGRVIASETFTNLSMDVTSNRFAPTLVSQSSALIDLQLAIEAANLGDPAAPSSFYNTIANSFAGYSRGRRPLGSGATAPIRLTALRSTLDSLINPAAGARSFSFEISVNGSAYQPVSLDGWTSASITAMSQAQIQTELFNRVTAALQSLVPVPTVTVVLEPISSGGSEGSCLVVTADSAPFASVKIRRASANDIAAALMLGVDQGGIEMVRRSNFRPAPTGSILRWDKGTGTLGNLDLLNAVAVLPQTPRPLTKITIDGVDIPLNSPPHDIQTSAADLFFVDNLSGAPNGHSDGVREKLRIIAAAINANPNVPYRADVNGYTLKIRALGGTLNQQPTITFTGAAASVTAFNNARQTNVCQYKLGTGGTSTFATAGVDGADDDGNPPDFADYVGDPTLHTGFCALDTVDLFNLMVLPADGAMSATSRESLWGPASVYCASRRAFLIIDAPDNWTAAGGLPAVVQTTSKVNDLRATVIKDYSAVFYPRLKYNDNGTVRVIGPAGAIAGLISRIDATRGVWKAPAGTEADIRNILGMEVKLTDMENGVLNKIGVNCLRVFPTGFVNWGARTLFGSDDDGSEWKYIPIRRLALFLEESLFRGTKWVVFEPNDEPLWAQIRLNLGAFMMSLFRQGAFQGSTPDKAFYVKCDGETTTQDDRNKGIVNIEVGFAPLKPAEFVVIKIQQMAGDLK